jgi:ubiquinone/menaquinone biosynthesis C-methylase UbiE
MNLHADTRAAHELDRRADSLRDFASIRAAAWGDAPTNRASARFARRYARMEREVGTSSGQGLLAKIEPFLLERGHPRIAGTWGLEAAGGVGLNLPGFAPRFERFVFVECSLVNIRVAQRLTVEHELSHVVFVRANIEALPFRDQTLAFVHEGGVIEHVADPDRMVKEALRVLAPAGVYVCQSPNKYPLSPEPHFLLPLFGLFPRRVRKVILPHLRGVSDETGTDLRSLRQLRGYFARAQSPVDIFFLPRGLAGTVRESPVRRFMRAALGSRVLGPAAHLVINRILLGIMPYQLAVSVRPLDAVR